MEELRKSDFYFDLPEELIAQDPLEDRSSSRLLVLNKTTGEVEHHVFKDIIDFLHEGDCLVLNNTKVIPARLMGVKADTGAAIEVLLLKRRENDIWETLVKPGKKARPGAVISFGDGILTGTVLDVVEEGNRLIQFKYEGIFEEVLDKLGEMPLPPYITHKLQDKNRYQTVREELGLTREKASQLLETITPERIEKIEKYYRNIPFDTAKYAGIMCGAYRAKEIMEQDIFAETVALPFENRSFQAFKEYDRYLTHLYGDYMTPPPESEQHPAHGILFVDTEKPYTEALKDFKTE